MPDCSGPEMTSVSESKRPPVFVIIACLLCAITIGFLCWNLTSRSDAQTTTPTDYFFFILYECLAVGSYLAALWFFKRLTTFRGTEIIPALFFVSGFGT